MVGKFMMFLCFLERKKIEETEKVKTERFLVGRVFIRRKNLGNKLV
jgi:hypothetical protein